MMVGQMMLLTLQRFQWCQDFFYVERGCFLFEIWKCTCVGVILIRKTTGGFTACRGIRLLICDGVYSDMCSIVFSYFKGKQFHIIFDLVFVQDICLLLTKAFKNVTRALYFLVFRI